ncbi:DUF2798 domain-containing protein [Intestinibacillus sp. Marseille-P6563]|uniref:DUF2798 domain-containing protein n=1 Tax=Intestinibacillus sp. Marseille-P6563 TaxID=2364792 RepID=UPI000F04DBDD|nr:DUF2798 domain-containing protein [Intestinibacillus sp. Marseille-P6563]
MPKTKFQNIIFTLLMAFVMVYAMVCYNIAWNVGGMQNRVFVIALEEIVIMWPVAFFLEFFVVEHLSQKLAFRLVTPGRDKPIFILLAISSMIVCLMCPIMSLIATILFQNPGSELIAVWLQTAAVNFPMALCWQIFFAGPLVRLIFRTIFRKQLQQDTHS